MKAFYYICNDRIATGRYGRSYPVPVAMMSSLHCSLLSLLVGGNNEREREAKMHSRSLEKGRYLNNRRV